MGCSQKYGKRSRLLLYMFTENELDLQASSTWLLELDPAYCVVQIIIFKLINTNLHKSSQTMISCLRFAQEGKDTPAYQLKNEACKCF